MKKIIVLLSFFSFFAISCEKDEVALEMDTFEQDVFDHVNVYRVSQGKAALEFNAVIFEQARAHCQNMASGNIPFSHDGFADRAAAIKAAIGGSNVAENIAMGYTSAFAVMNGWKESTAHNENMLGNFTHAAVSVETAKDGTMYYTMIFLKK